MEELREDVKKWITAVHKDVLYTQKLVKQLVTFLCPPESMEFKKINRVEDIELRANETNYRFLGSTKRLKLRDIYEDSFLMAANFTGTNEQYNLQGCPFFINVILKYKSSKQEALAEAKKELRRIKGKYYQRKYEEKKGSLSSKAKAEPPLKESEIDCTAQSEQGGGKEWETAWCSQEQIIEESPSERSQSPFPEPVKEEPPSPEPEKEKPSHPAKTIKKMLSIAIEKKQPSPPLQTTNQPHPLASATIQSKPSTMRVILRPASQDQYQKVILSPEAKARYQNVILSPAGQAWYQKILLKSGKIVLVLVPRKIGKETSTPTEIQPLKSALVVKTPTSFSTKTQNVTYVRLKQPLKREREDTEEKDVTQKRAKT